ncbi:MAG TPA: hypothetical protein VGY55_13785 [Pirellulales bacterium]|jgi:hypothetical protein|nr:hypothetical protein [Pirellulales bacterium]
MEPEELYGALRQMGAGEIHEPIRPDILTRLAELKVFQVEHGKSTLTKLGERRYVATESGDAPPDFE